MELYDKIISIDPDNREYYIESLFNHETLTLNQLRYLMDSDLNIDVNCAFVRSCHTYNQNLEKIIYLLNSGANINYKSGCALCSAILLNNKLLIKFLLDNDIVLTNEHFQMAITCHNMDVIKYMIDYGFKITTKYIKFASNDMYIDTLQIFINEGVSPNDICEYYFKKIMKQKACLAKDMLLFLSNNHVDFVSVINKLNKI